MFLLYFIMIYNLDPKIKENAPSANANGLSLWLSYQRDVTVKVGGIVVVDTFFIEFTAFEPLWCNKILQFFIYLNLKFHVAVKTIIFSRMTITVKNTMSSKLT